MLIAFVFSLLPGHGHTTGFNSGSVYEVPLEDGYKSDMDVLLTTGGPILVLTGQNGKVAYEGKQGTPIRHRIPSEEIIRTLGFVPTAEVSGLLARLGCGQAFPGCTSPEDADFVLKVETKPNTLKFTYMSLEKLRERFLTAMGGEAEMHFDDEDIRTSTELVTQRGTEGRWGWRDAAVDKIRDIPSLTVSSIARENLRQFPFADDGRLLARKAIGGRVMEESLLDVLEQRGCRLLAGAIAKESPKRGSDWLGLAFQEGMLKQCRNYSVQFRFGLFDGRLDERQQFAAAIKRLACTHKSERFSEDYWCAGVGVEGRSCELFTMQCAPPTATATKHPSPSSNPTPPLKLQKLLPTSTAPVLSDRKNQWLSLFGYTTLVSQGALEKPLQKDTRSLGISFFATPTEDAKDGKFIIKVWKSREGAALMQDSAYKVSLKLALEIVRKDVCTNPVSCIFAASNSDHRRVEQRVVDFVLYKDANSPEKAARTDVSFGILRLDGKRFGLDSTLSVVRLAVDSVTRIEETKE